MFFWDKKYKIINLIEGGLGLLGIIMRNNFPRFYNLLKNVKNEKS
jgi:hypothetical protein